jgi:undecaprenyl-diphosphatase
MEFVQAVILGLVQGLAEFLPISSSGHLVVVPGILGWEEFAGNVAFDVLLHAGSLVAVAAYFRDDLLRMALAIAAPAPERAADRRLALLIVAGTAVTGCIGLLFADFFESLFHSLASTGAFLLVTSFILVTAERLSRVHERRTEDMTLANALLIGLAQAAAIAPGISRSGATISAGLWLGLSRERAARFSFLLSAPIVFLATAKTAVDVVTQGASLPALPVSMLGFIASTVASYAAISWLITYLKSHSLYPFAIYTGLLGLGVLVWSLIII